MFEWTFFVKKMFVWDFLFFVSVAVSFLLYMNNISFFVALLALGWLFRLLKWRKGNVISIVGLGVDERYRRLNDLYFSIFNVVLFDVFRFLEWRIDVHERVVEAKNGGDAFAAYFNFPYVVAMTFLLFFVRGAVLESNRVPKEVGLIVEYIVLYAIFMCGASLLNLVVWGFQRKGVVNCD